jgi:hypothetical protein
MRAEAIAAGLTLLVIGGAFLWGGGHVWHAAKRDKARKGWRVLLVALVVFGGLGIGGGLSLMFGLNFFYTKVGIIPLWIVLALASGIWFLVDLVKRHHWTRTTVLGFITAALIAVPTAGPVMTSSVTHGHQLPQVTSVTHKGKG